MLRLPLVMMYLFLKIKKNSSRNLILNLIKTINWYISKLYENLNSGETVTGWPTTMFFSRNHQVIVVDNFIKKKSNLSLDLNH